MADTDTKTVMTEYPARLQMSMLAPVKAIAAAIPEGDKEVYIVGYVFGEARGVSFRNNPNSTDGEAAKALIGVFEGIPSYQDMDGVPPCSERARLASGVCFLPTQAQETIVAAVLANDNDPRPSNTEIKRGQRSDKIGVVVPISAEIGIRKSSSPVGYEWVVRGLANASAVDPVERMRLQLGTGAGANLAKIVDQTEKAAAKAIAAPAPKAPAKKSRKR